MSIENFFISDKTVLDMIEDDYRFFLYSVHYYLTEKLEIELADDKLKSMRTIKITAKNSINLQGNPNH